MAQNEEEQFIKEKIKDKPKDKKKLLQKCMATAGFAIIFGFVSCLVFSIMRPIMEGWFEHQEPDRIEYPRDEIPEDTVVSMEDTQQESQADDTEETQADDKEETKEPEKERTVYITEEKTLELKDYQELQNQLYRIGRQANKSVVTVTGITEGKDIFESPYEAAGQTSGIIIGKNRRELLILTEYQVVADARTIQITFISNDIFNAELKKYDDNMGIAVLSVPLADISKATMNQIEIATLGNSLSLKLGQVVIAAGSPLGTNYSILTGNITSVTNTITTEDFNYTVFTTDIVTNSRGNGALINIDGEVVGLILSDPSLQREENTLAAVSVSELKDIIEMLSNDQNIPYIGIKGNTVTDVISEEYEIPKGVYIRETVMDSPAMEAGLQNGDVIVAIDGEEILNMEGYKQKLLSLTPEDEVEVTVSRQGAEAYKEFTCTVQVGAK